MRDMEIRRIWWFDKAMRFGNSFTRGLRGPVQIMISKSHILRQYQTPIAPYHRYKGLSSIPNLAGDRQTYSDIKHPIYKHYLPYMGICGYEGLADMKV